MLKVQELLKAEGLGALSPYHIQVKEAEDFYLLNYTAKSPKYDAIACECRGLILDKKFDLMCKTFNRFFNWNDTPVYPDRFDRVDVTEKLDGTLVNVWFNRYAGRWECSTRGSIFADGPVGDLDITFKEMFTSVIPMERFEELNDQLCLAFELVGPENKVIKQYLRREAFLIGIYIRGEDCSEYSFVRYTGKVLNIRTPRLYTFATLDDCLAEVAALPPQDEGYVVRWECGDRVKVKNPAHLALARVNNNYAPRAKDIVRMIDDGGLEEFLSHFPEHVGMSDEYVRAREQAEAVCWTVLGVTSQKPQDEAIEMIKATGILSPILFRMWRNGETFNQVYYSLDMSRRLKLYEHI